jgi:hypothetical protein
MVVRGLCTERGVGTSGVGHLRTCGYLVSSMSGRRQGGLYPAIAVIFSLVGIVLGKYLVFFSALKSYVLQHGMCEPTLFSPGSVLVFGLSITRMFGLLDVAFVYSAVHTAWKLPMKMSTPVVPIAAEAAPAIAPAEQSDRS